MREQRNFSTVLAAAAVALSLTLAGCTGADAPKDDSGSSSDPMPNGKAHEGNVNTGPKQGSDLATTEFDTSWHDAVETAQSNFDGELTEVELNWYKERYAYTIEMVSDTKEYTTHIEASTGDMLDDRGEGFDSDDKAEKQSEVLDLDNIVSWDDALATALDAQNGTVNEWKLEGTESGPHWQFDIDAESGEDYEVTVDAVSGDLITTDD